MNYWPRWISAIKKRTATLSLAEMGAYDRLLDHYYAEEQPLPADLDECCRIAVALTKDERKAVEKVLAKFFTLMPDGYRNERADEEIALALPKIAAAQANGKRGGRPKGTGKQPTGNPPGYPQEPTPKAPHPHPQKHQTEGGQERARAPDEGDADDSLPDLSGFQPTPGGLACQAIKAAGIADVNPSHVDLQRLLAAGVTAQELGDAAAVCVLKGKPHFAYLLSTVEGQRRDAAAKAAVPAEVAKPITVPATDRRGDDYLAQHEARTAQATKPPSIALELARKLRTA